MAGLLLIAFISPSVNPPMSSISEISSSSLEKRVRVSGLVSDVHRFDGGSMLLTVEDDGGEIDVYLSYSVAGEFEDFDLEGCEAEFTGDVKLYRGRLEVVVDMPEDVVLK
ncbi:MAG: hypothetical protein GF416_00615 [Candidatus Altiarchaeales archaeon]|nr:hypothetical protein [Candidatus Altiarchaeales archaeon]